MYIFTVSIYHCSLSLSYRRHFDRYNIIYLLIASQIIILNLSDVLSEVKSVVLSR